MTDNSVKNHRTITNLKLALCIPMTHLRMQFQPYTCIKTNIRELKLKLISRGKNSVKNN
jgi:hypothetical protein